MTKPKRRAIESVYTAEIALIESRIGDIRTKLSMIGRENRFSAGLYAGMVKGFAIGLAASLLFFGILFAYFIP